MMLLTTLTALVALAAPVTEPLAETASTRTAQQQLHAAADWSQMLAAHRQMDTLRLMSTELALRASLESLSAEDELFELPVPGASCSMEGLRGSPAAALRKAAELVGGIDAPSARAAASELWLARALSSAAEGERDGYTTAMAQAYVGWKLTEVVMLQNSSQDAVAAARLAGLATRDLSEQACKDKSVAAR